LRIEDTDELRSDEKSVKSIFSSLKWLGLDWDEGAMPDGTEIGNCGPYIQSKREEMGIYRKYADQLIREGKAYHCYCTPQELEKMKKKAQLEKKSLKYDGRCRRLTKSQIEEFKKEGRKPVVRFKMPQEGKTVFEDLIHKTVSFENRLLYDCVIIKASGYPTYNFACVIDDCLMKITHVMRGDDHISNTPLQVNIYRALGFDVPRFAHLSMILGPDGRRLSKRHGSTSVEEYRRRGFLPLALRNYLALLGFSTSDSQQLFKEKELEEKFCLEGCQKNPAVFDEIKLRWMNGEYIRMLSREKLFSMSLPFLEKKGLKVQKNERNIEIVALQQEKYKLLEDVPYLVEFFYRDVEYASDAVEKVLKKPRARAILESIQKVYREMKDFTEKEIEAKTREFARSNNYKTAEIFHPVRVSVSGRTQGPTLFKMLELLGREETVRRISIARRLLESA